MKTNLTLLLILFSSIFSFKVNAQTKLSLANESWWIPKTDAISGGDGTNLVLDAAGNGYIVNKIGNNYYLTRRQTTGVTDTTWLFLGSTSNTFNLNAFNMPEFSKAIVYKPSDGNLYFVWKRTTRLLNFVPMDSVFVAQVSNLGTTPILTKRWKEVDEVFSRYGNGPGGQEVQGIISLNISPSENMYVIAKTRIHKISNTGVLTQKFCTPYSYYRTEISDITWDNNDNIFVTRKRYQDGPITNPSFAPVDPYITKINSTGIADTTWFKTTNDTLVQDPIRVSFLNGFVYSSHIVRKPNADTLYCWKINSSTRNGQLINKMTYPLTNSGRATTASVFSDSANNVYFAINSPYLIHRVDNNGLLDSAWLNLEGPTVYLQGMPAIGGPGNQMYIGPRFLPKIISIPFPPFTDFTYSFYYSKLVGSAFNVNISKQDATCISTNNGWAKATSNGCIAGSYTYLWTPGNYTTDSIGGLAPGTYNVRVTCSGDTVNKSVVIASGSGPAAPTTSSLVIYTGTKTLSQLNITGTNVQFYNVATGGSALAGTTTVQDDSTYYVTQTLGGCESNRKQIVVNRIVNDSMVVCSPATVADLTNTPQTGNTTNWFTIATGGTALADTTSIPTGTNTYYVEEFSTVASNRVPVTVIVNPTPNVLPTADTTVCNGSTIPAINFATTTTGSTVTYNWTNDNPSIGLAASGTGNIASFVATNPSTTPLAQTATIIVTPTITNAGITCEGVKDTFLIAVNPTIGVPEIANQVVCNGTPTTAVSFGGIRDRAFSIVYNWTNNTPSIGLAASGTGNIPSVTAINNGNAPVTATIVVTPAYTNNGVSCDGTPRTFTITVNPTTKVDTIANQIVCNGANTTVVNFSSPTIPIAIGSTIVYDWTNNNTNIGLATSGTDSIASFVATNTGTTPDTATITVTPTFTNAGRTCIGTPRTFSIIVNPTATVNSIINKVACNGSIVAAVMTTSPNTGGTVTYAWVNNNTAIGLAASGTGAIPSFTATNIGTSALTATVTITPTFTIGAVSCTGTSSSYTITINPPPVFNTIANQVACNGASTSVVPFNTTLTGGTAAFAWTNSNTAIGLAASGTGSLPSFTATNNTNEPISGTISVVMTYTNAGLSCVSLPQTFTYTVNPTANVNLTNDAIVCNGATVPAANFTTTATGGTVTYAWSNDNTSIGLAASGTGNIASFTGVNTSTAPATATVIVTPTFTNGGVSCTGVKDTFFITVNPTVTVNTISNQVVCNGSAVNAINFGTSASGGTTTYAWTNNTTSIGLAASGTGNMASFTATNTGTSSITATITVTPTFTNGGVSCTGNAKTFTITVNPTAIVNTISNQIVCNGGAVTAISFGTNATGGTTTYAWSNNTTSIGLAASGTGNIASFNGINTGTAPVTATITVTPTFTNGGTSCVGAAKTFTITVNPTATVSPISNKVECNGSTVTAVTPSSPNTGGTVTYAWVNNNTAIGLAASGTGTIPSFTATNTGTSPVTAIVTITPTFTNAGVSCTGTNFSYTITINPPPIFNAISNQVACNGANTSVVNFSTALTGGTSVFNWTNNSTAIGLAASGTGSLPSFTATNTTTAPISGTISVIMTYTNAGLSCISLPQTFTYVVNPTATVNAINNQTLCNRAATSAINFSSPTTGGSIVYNWTNNNPSIGLAANGSGNIPVFTTINSTTIPIIATITVTPTFSNAGISCTGIARTFTITVNPTPVTNFNINNPAQCFKNNQFLFTNTTTNASSYLWNLGDGNNSVLTNVTKTYSIPNSYNVKLQSTNIYSCMDSIAKTITIYPQPAKPIVVPVLGNGIHSSVLANSYQWFNNNVVISNSNSQYLYPLSAGFHQVQVSTINGCTEKSDSSYYIPEKNFTANLDQQYVFVYPIPVTNGEMNIHFNLPLVHKVEFSLYTNLGQFLQKVEIPEGTTQYKMNLKKYPSANYLIRFNDYYKLIKSLYVPVSN